MTVDIEANWAPSTSNGDPLAKSSITPVVQAGIGTPEWWRDRLFARISARRNFVESMNDYYVGNHPLPWLPEQAKSEFRRILRMTRSNYLGLVCDSQVERMAVQGFRIGDDATADKATWRIFQANNMDSDLDQGFLEAAKSGTAYLMVGPNPDDASTPLMSVEHPLQTVTECVPGHRRKRAAGLKTWIDDWTGNIIVALYLPDMVYKWSAKASTVTTGVAPRWVPAGDPVKNPVGEVPIYELTNNPQLMGGGRSEIDDLTDIQDRVNKTIADRLITQDFGAFPQKWATGFAEEDSEGNPTEIDIGRNRLVTTEVKETQFGQWASAPLDPYSEAKREDVKDIASRSRTPAQYLLGEMSNVNGEALALDTPIPTPSGMVAIGEIQSGDLVFDETGAIQHVEHAHPVLNGRPCYRITFDDGASFIADAGHRWAVASIAPGSRECGPTTRNGRSVKSVLTTEAIASSLKTGNGQFVHAVNLAGAPDLPEMDFTVDPYVLGAWLADGVVGNGTVCSGDDDLEEMVSMLTSAGETVTVRESRTVNLITCHKNEHHKALRGRLNDLGIMRTKRIPESYFLGSYKQRLSLMQGIMDTDGSAVKRQKGCVELTLHDGDLAKDVHRLACSLGDKVTLHATPYRDYIRYRMRWNPADAVFRMERKAKQLEVKATNRPKARRRVIISVDRVESVPVRCLTVSGPSHLFLAGIEHVPTHNTLKASESGLISKVRQRFRGHEDGIEDAARAVRKLAGIATPDDVMLETMWRNPEYRTEGEVTDAAIKRYSSGVATLRQTREDVGYSAAQISRMEAEDAAAMIDPQLDRIVRPFTDVTGGAA